jgi:hypothetical protein
MSSNIESRIASSRADLENTLDAIEDKLNVPKRVSELGRKVSSSYEANPLPWIVGATAAAIAVAGIIAWAILSDDD